MSINSIPNRQGSYPPPPKKRKDKKIVPIIVGVCIILGSGLLVRNLLSSNKTTDVSQDNSSIITTESKYENSDMVVNDSSSMHEQNVEHEETVETTKSKSTSISVDAIASVPVSIDKIEENKSSVGNAIIDQFNGNISVEGQEDTYNFTPEIDGIYRFEFSNIPNNIHHSIYLYNSENEELDRNTSIGNGSGVTVRLNGGQSYVIKVKQSWNTGSYTLNIGHQKATETISELTKISDSIQFTHQENDYIFVPELDGLYRFEFSDIPNDIRHSIYVYNSIMEELDHNTSIGNGSGVTINLSAGLEYHIVVKQSWNLGSYSLNIGKQKPIVDISDKTVISDSIQYINQENIYDFKPQNDGLYRFEFANIPNDISHSIYVYNSGYEELDRNTGIGNSSGISINLKANETYHIAVKQNWHVGSYDLLVGTQKEVVDISELRIINDSIQFTSQENRYIYVPNRNGEISFKFSNIPDDVSMSLYVYNSDWEELDRNTGIQNEQGIKISLNLNSTYYIVVKQNWKFGGYTLNVS